MKKSLNELRDEAFACAEKQGFHERPMNLGERLMLVVSELSEALEADRAGKWAPRFVFDNMRRNRVPLLDQKPEFYGQYGKYDYETFIRGTVEEEIADAIIRLVDIAGIYGIDLDWHVAAKMAYNKTRPYKHGKNYG
jgi:NTP pyrophosphatase (non-canonical NTP hydrolase)